MICRTCGHLQEDSHIYCLACGDDDIDESPTYVFSDDSQSMYDGFQKILNDLGYEMYDASKGACSDFVVKLRNK